MDCKNDSARGLEMNLETSKPQQEPWSIFGFRNTPDPNLLNSRGLTTRVSIVGQLVDKFFPAPKKVFTPQAVVSRTEVRLVNQLERAGIPREELFKPNSTTYSGRAVGEYLDAQNENGEQKYELRLLSEPPKQNKPQLTFIDDSKSAEFYHDMLERMQEDQGMSRVWTLMSFASVIPKSVLVALGGLATGHENPFVRSLAGSLMPTVADIARKVALSLAKAGKTEYARELMQAMSSINLAQCDTRNSEDCESGIMEETGHVYAASDADIHSISPNRYTGLQAGFHIEDSEKIAIVDKEIGEVVDYLDIARLDHEGGNYCEESCYVVQIVNESITNAASRVEEALSQANQDSAKAIQKKDSYLDANIELNIVKAKKSKTKDPKEQAALDQREAQLQQTIFYNA